MTLPNNRLPIRSVLTLLLMEAAKEYLSPQMNKDYYHSNNVMKRSRSRASSVALLPFKPQKLFQDENLNAFFNDNDNGFNLDGGNERCDSETDFTSTVCSVSRDDSISINQPKLATHDLKWIQLINDFKSIHDPNNPAISTIETIISNDPAIF